MVIYVSVDDPNRRLLSFAKDLPKNGRRRVYIKVFSRGEFDEASEFLQENCDILRQSDDDIPKMFVTGLGGHQYSKRFEEVFKVK